MLAEGIDLNTAFNALGFLLMPSRAEAGTVDPRMEVDAWFTALFRHARRIDEVSAVVHADALAILHAALTPAGPFVTIPKLGKAFHIRQADNEDIEIVTDDGIRAGRNWSCDCGQQNILAAAL
jgi:hypothetical protein